MLAAEAIAAADASRGFALLGDGAGVLRCVLVRVDSPREERHLLLLNVHHVAFDGASTGVLLGGGSASRVLFVSPRRSDAGGVACSSA